MRRYTYGTTPEQVIREQFAVLCPQGTYTVSCRHESEDCEVLRAAVNHGIDAHLEAVRFEHVDSFGRLIVTITDAQSLCVLLRRLWESDDEAAECLRSSILTTLEIEEV